MFLVDDHSCFIDILCRQSLSFYCFFTEVFILLLLMQLCVPWENWIISETGEVIIINMHLRCICVSKLLIFWINGADLFCSLILSFCSSYFTSLYMTKWKEFFPHKELMQPPRFEAEALCYPKLKILCEYLSWRQAECKLFFLQT
jgi:hypothetical protein